jgi:uncharacterized OsmC-like protein
MLIRYLGKLAFKVKERKHFLVVDQAADKGGRDLGPTPTELFIASLGTCIGMYVARFCETRRISRKGMKIELLWQRGDNPPRIADIKAKIKLNHKVPRERKKALLRAAESCFIQHTLENAPNIKITLD